MSSATPAPEPVNNVADASAVAVAPAAPSEPAGAQKSDELQKLLQHMEGLQNQNSEMVQVLESLAASKRHELDGIIEKELMPWINSLKIPDELKENFIRGIKEACLKTNDRKDYKSLLNFTENPVLGVMCGAAQAHGEAIRQVEDSRRELQEATLKSQQLHDDTAANSRRVETTARHVLFSGPDDGASAGDKRRIDAVAPDDAPHNSRCWNALFESFA